MAEFSRLTGSTGSDWVDAGNGGAVPFGVLALNDPNMVAALRQRAAAPLRASKAQQSTEFGLFGDSAKQRELF